MPFDPPSSSLRSSALPQGAAVEGRWPWCADAGGLAEAPLAEAFLAPEALARVALAPVTLSPAALAPAGLADATAGAAVLGGTSKRAVDLLVAGLALLLLAPLLATVVVLLRLTTGGPVLYAHRRMGYGGRPFDCYKFRTMVPDGDAVLADHLARHPEAAREWRETRKLRRDPRVTRLGAALRVSSLDELPQLINVLRGEMSCVGPRPVVREELERFGPQAAEYLRARPGVTGLWQVSGRSRLTYADRVRLDAQYVRTWSLRADLVILARTAGALLRTGETA